MHSNSWISEWLKYFVKYFENRNEVVNVIFLIMEHPKDGRRSPAETSLRSFRVNNGNSPNNQQQKWSWHTLIQISINANETLNTVPEWAYKIMLKNWKELSITLWLFILNIRKKENYFVHNKNFTKWSQLFIFMKKTQIIQNLKFFYSAEYQAEN